VSLTFSLVASSFTSLPKEGVQLIFIAIKNPLPQQCLDLCAFGVVALHHQATSILVTKLICKL
jgi:hypothetical protein